MDPKKIATASLATVLALGLAGCGETKSEKTEVVTCKKVAQLVLHNPETLTFVKERVEETSEGNEIFLDIEYKSGDTSGKVWDMCWFSGYSDKKKLKTFSFHDENATEFKEIPAADLAAIVAQLPK